MTRQGHKPGDVEVPLLPDVEPWPMPAVDPARNQEMVYQALRIRHLNQQVPRAFEDITHVGPRQPRLSLRERFIEWWCSHASPESRGLA